MNVNFYLDKKSTKPEKTIFVYIRGISNGNTIVLHTGEKINPKFWDVKKQQVKKSYTGSPELNETLSKIKTDIQKIHRDLINDNSFATIQDFKTRLIKQFKKEEPKFSGFYDVYEMFLDMRKTELSNSMIKKYRVLRNHLKEFEKTTKYKVKFESMNLLFFDKFTQYLMEIKLHTNNTVSKLIDLLKTYMRWATERNLNSNLEYKKFKTKEEKTEIVYLTEKELMKLYKLNLKKRPTLEQVRDTFCFACFTGQRFSDLSNISRQDIKGDVWYLRVQKTKDVNQLPLNDFAIEILHKYKDNSKPLPVISGQKTNQYLKEICKLAEINELITITKYRGAERIEKTYPKYELISTHTGRRTFVTLSLEKGMRPEIVMEITGHKDYRTFKKYIKLTSKVKQVEMKNIWRKEPIMKIAKVV